MTDNNTTTTKIREQLRALLQLTQTEMQVAEARVAQASTEAVRRELKQNSRHAGDRTEAIAEQLRALGGYPDVVTPVVGRLGALVKATLEQAEPLSEALLQDLQLEHMLLDRARYLKALATAGEHGSAVKLADRLIEAHIATVEWLTTVLAEEALGGPAALVATPLQRVAGVATRAATLPNRVAVEGVNRYVDSVQRTADQAKSRLSGFGEKAAEFAGDAREVLTSGRNASLQRAERIARREGNRDTAEALHDTRADLGALQVSELPIKDYDTLGTTAAVSAIKELDRPDDVRAVIAYEQAHKNRSSVVSAAQTRLAAIAKKVVGV